MTREEYRRQDPRIWKKWNGNVPLGAGDNAVRSAENLCEALTWDVLMQTTRKHHRHDGLVDQLLAARTAPMRRR